MIREAIRAVKSLYMQDINAMGLKFSGASLSPFLWMRMIVDSFQSCGILCSDKHLLKIRASI